MDLKELYTAIYCEKNKAIKAEQTKLKVEADYGLNFANFVKIVQKKYRGASKDSAVSAGDHLHHLHKDGQTCEKCKIKAEEHNRNVSKRLSGILHLDAANDENQAEAVPAKG